MGAATFPRPGDDDTEGPPQAGRSAGSPVAAETRAQVEVEMRWRMGEREAMAADMLAKGMAPDQWAIAVEAATGKLIGPVPLARGASEEAVAHLGEQIAHLADLAIAYVNGHEADSYNRGTVSYTELKAQAKYVESLKARYHDGEADDPRFVGEG